MTDELKDFIKSTAKNNLLPWKKQLLAAEKFNLSVAQIEKAILELNIIPARYERNLKTISAEDQLILFQSKVAVIGCGGLGGYIIEELARLGVGNIVVVDPDNFEEHNLNRHILSSIAALGSSKVEYAFKRVKEINPAVNLEPYQVAFSKTNAADLFKQVDVMVDGLDSISVRLELAEICDEMSIPLVHGSIAGWYGQVITNFPGDNVLQAFYINRANPKGIEKELGNPSFTPAIIASLQVAEVCKILLKRGECLRKRMLFVDLINMKMDEVEIIT